MDHELGERPPEDVFTGGGILHACVLEDLVENGI
jgi:hypothetical protein